MNASYDNARKSANNIHLELIDGEGRAVSHTTAEFDGYYLFRNVLPGNYKVKVPDDVLESKHLKYVEQEKIVVTEADFLVQNVTLQYIDGHVPEAIKKEVSDVIEGEIVEDQLINDVESIRKAIERP